MISHNGAISIHPGDGFLQSSFGSHLGPLWSLTSLCLALVLVLPVGNCAELRDGKGGAGRAAARMEPPFSALEGSLFPRDAIPVLGHPALHIQA